VLNLITACSYGQHNTVVYKQGDSYRGIPHRQTILVNPEDLAACGLRTHQQVTVQGEVAAEATAPLRSRCHHGGAGRRRQ